jgi:hypothetical protein
METCLKEALMELIVAQLIIEIHQKGSNMRTTPEHVSSTISKISHE